MDDELDEFHGLDRVEVSDGKSGSRDGLTSRHHPAGGRRRETRLGTPTTVANQWAAGSGATTTPSRASVGTRLGVRIATALAVVAAIGLAAGTVVGAVPAAVALAVGALLPATVVDVRERRLPDEWTAGAALVLVGASSVGAAVAGTDIPIGSIGAGVVVFAGPLLAVHLVSPRAMGFGDVKVAAVLGAAAGVVDWRLALVALTLAAGAAGAVGVASRARTVPFGPFLVFASAVVLLTDHVWLAGLVEGGHG